MTTTTLQNLRRQFGAYFGYGEQLGKDGEAWTTTTNIGASTTIISTELRDYGFDDIVDSGSGDDMFENWWVIIHGSNNAQTVRRVKSYDASAGQITVAGTNLSSESSNTDFELHKYSPTLIREILNTARLRSFPDLCQPINRTLWSSRRQNRFEVPSTIIGIPTSIYLERGVAADYGNNILSNADFETFASSAFTSWSTTTLDIAQEDLTTTPTNYAVFRGQSSARCTSQTGNTGTLLQSISSPGSYSGQTINLSIWVYCLTASVVSTSIVLNGSITLGTANDGGLHTGNGWELLTTSVNSTVTISSLNVGVSVVSTTTDNTEFYVDDAICVIGPSQEPGGGRIVLSDWRYEPIMQGTSQRNEIFFPYDLPDNYALRFEGRGYLSSLSAETDTIEIGQPQTDLLIAHAVYIFFERSSYTSPDNEGNFDLMRRRVAEQDIERLSYHRVRAPRHRMVQPGWTM
jgi:hypothetical protein